MIEGSDASISASGRRPNAAENPLAVRATTNRSPDVSSMSSGNAYMPSPSPATSASPEPSRSTRSARRRRCAASRTRCRYPGNATSSICTGWTDEAGCQAAGGMPVAVGVGAGTPGGSGVPVGPGGSWAGLATPGDPKSPAEPGQAACACAQSAPIDSATRSKLRPACVCRPCHLPRSADRLQHRSVQSTRSHPRHWPERSRYRHSRPGHRRWPLRRHCAPGQRSLPLRPTRQRRWRADLNPDPPTPIRAD